MLWFGSLLACGTATTPTAPPTPSSSATAFSAPSSSTSSVVDRDPAPPSGKCIGDAECDFGLFTKPDVACAMSEPSSKDCPFACIESACAQNPNWNHTGGKCKADADCHPPYARLPMTCSSSTHVCEGFSLPAWGLLSPAPPSARCSASADCNRDLFAHPEVQCSEGGSPEDCPFACVANACANNPGWNHKGGTCASDADCHPHDPKQKMVCDAHVHVCEVQGPETHLHWVLTGQPPTKPGRAPFTKVALVVQGGAPPRLELGSFMGDCVDQVVTWSTPPLAQITCAWAGALSHIAVMRTGATELTVKRRDDDEQAAASTKFPERALGRATIPASSKIILDP